MHGTQLLDRLDNFQQVNCDQIDIITNAKYLFNVKDSIKLIHFNIRSYFKNIDCLLILLDSLNIFFDIIVLTEAWADEYKTLITLDDYDVFNTTNNFNRNDGVIVYLSTKLCGVATQITLGEATGLQLDFDTDGRHYSLLAVYRSPAMDCNLFLADLQKYYHVTKNTTTYIFTGDMNIDTLTTSKQAKEKDSYLNILYEAGLTECIYKPTRVTEHSETCIDHIFIKHSDYNAICAAVLTTDLTDHYAVLAGVARGTPNSNTSTGTTNTYLDQQQLRTLLETQPWDLVLAQRDVNTCCNIFLDIFENLKQQSLKPRKQSSRNKKLKPWITIDLIQKIRKRDKLSKALKNNLLMTTLR